MFQIFGQFVYHVLYEIVTILCKNILSAVNCTEPPERPGAGTWEWNKDYSFETEIINQFNFGAKVEVTFVTS